MSTLVINNRKYRVTSKAKFIFSTLLLTLIFISILATIGFFVYNHYNTERIERELAMLKEKYSFTIGEINIEATSADEALEKLKTQTKLILDQKNEKIIQQEIALASWENKYKLAVEQAKEITRQDVKLYNEFAYALDFPDSDMTLADIKMIIEICEEENVNPHLWLSLVKLESGFKSYVRSTKSTAAGWGQVLAGTGKSVYENYLKLGKYDHKTMGTDKEINARISIHYLARLIKEKGSIERALISYNGNELGQTYVTIIDTNLRKHTGLSISKLARLI